jgi:EmrB/QacA subfamily drug resistance transporter
MTLLSKRHPDVAGQRPVTALHSGRPAGPAPSETGALTQRAKTAVPGWAVLAVCCLAQLMVVLDISIVNVALPQMKSGLHLSADGQQWVVNAYTLTFAGLLMLGGRAADLFGRRRVLLIGLGLFTGFSLLGGLAQDGAWLIIARALQGASGAVLAPATLSLLTTSFRDPAGRRRALGAWSATATSGAAIGVLAGGILTDLAGWRWVLFVNVPIGIALLAGAARAVPESPIASTGRRLDVPGALAVTAGLALVVYGIVSTRTHPWDSAQTICILVAGAALLAAFAVIEARLADSPLVPLAVFRRKSLSAANGVSITFGASILSVFFFLSLYLQQVNRYTPLRAGLAFLPLGLSILAAALLAAQLVARLGVRRQLVTGLLLAAAGLAWMTQLTPGDGYWPGVFLPELLAGTGFGLSFMPMTLGATAGIPPQQAGLASGLLNTTRQVGGAIGLAATATAAAAVHAHSAARQTVAAALTSGYDRAFGIGAVALIAGALVALLLPARLGTAHAADPVPERPQPAKAPAEA